jgi:OmpA-OmpF porin, OOP family
MSLEREETSVAETRSFRSFRRANGDGLPFFPYGLFPLLGLLLLTLIAWTTFAPHSIESVARKTAEQALVDTGADWARVDVSGQWITVSGLPPTPEAGERLLNTIRTARASTWLGLARPATRVSGKFGLETAGTGGPGNSQTVNSALSGNQGTPEFLFRLSGGKLTLDGRVPDIATRDALAEAANANRPVRIEEIESNLEAMGIPAPEGFEDIALRGVRLLKLCDTGTASFTSLHFNLRCELPESEADQVRVLASAATSYGTIGEIEVLAREVVETCELELARLLEASRIEFDPGSALISSSKAALLDLTARAAGDCPGTLRVEGHTDNTGSNELNTELSRRRAEAVRAALIQRGVAPSRLIAAGYGSAQPLGDNATEEGRALNRRIEVRIVRPNE